MNAQVSQPDRTQGAARNSVVVRGAGDVLRQCVIVAGLGSTAAFIVIGLTYQLQMYGDGSLFSYSVAAQDAWAFHWHNISGRLTAYAFALLPGEIYVGLTGNAGGGIFLYGLMFFSAQLAGLIATYALDRSPGRILFTFACASNACFCPLVFGFPTEMWMAHALFWPALALGHYGRDGVAGVALLFAVLLALVFSHAGGVVMAVAILTTVGLRGWQDIALRRLGSAGGAALAVWVVVKLLFPPDAYFSEVLDRAGAHFFDLVMFDNPLLLLLAAALAGYVALFVVLRQLAPARAHVYAALVVAVALAIYWPGFDHALHTQSRYFMRTALLLGALSFGTLAALYALAAESKLALPLVPHLMTLLRRDGVLRLASGAIMLVVLVHAVETAKFVTVWTDYKIALRDLANGTASDPWLGDPRFVSANRIAPAINRMSWNSTTPYLTILLSPKFAPARLVIDPAGNYFWLTCEAAAASEQAVRAIPLAARTLLRVFACQHRLH